MSNKVEILVEVDPTGRGAAAIKSISANIDTLGRKTKEAGGAGREAADGLAGGLGIPLSIGGATAALGAGILVVGSQAKDAALNAANATRVLKSDAQEAGLAFDVARIKAQKFGQDLAVSNAQAEVSFARFLRVVKAAGELKNLDKFQKQFTDLAAAYGLTATEVETLTSQLLSGQDEALNRLGIADPSGLYKLYAAQVGKTVENLTEEEKVRARLLAVAEKGAKFAGVAAQRLASEVGQWATLKKNIEDATVALGEYITKSVVGSKIPTVINAAVKNPVSAILAGSVIGSPFFLEQIKAEMELEVDKVRMAANAARLAAALKIKADQTAFIAKFSGTVDPAEQAKIKEGFTAQYEALFKSKNLDATTADFAERQFKQIGKIFDPEKAKEFEEKFTAFWDKYSKTALDALKKARDAADGNFGRLAELGTDANNPFLKILLPAEERARSLQETFSILGDRVVDTMLKAERAATRQALLGAQLDAQLSANAKRREADALASFSGLTGSEGRKLGVVDRQIEAAQNIPALLATANALARGLTKVTEGQFNEKGERTNPNEPLKRELVVDADKVNKDILERLLDVNKLGLGGAAGTQAQEKITAAIVDLFDGLSPEMKARIARGEEGQGVKRIFEDALRDTAQSYTDAVKQEIANAKVADEAINSVKKDIADINAARQAGLSTAAADARLLATTGNLAPGEMSADVRQARIEALRRDADRDVAAQVEADLAIDRARISTEALTKSIDALAVDMRNPSNRKLLIEITKRAGVDARTELYGSLGGG